MCTSESLASQNVMYCYMPHNLCILYTLFTGLAGTSPRNVHRNKTAHTITSASVPLSTLEDDIVDASCLTGLFLRW